MAMQNITPAKHDDDTNKISRYAYLSKILLSPLDHHKKWNSIEKSHYTQLLRYPYFKDIPAHQWRPYYMYETKRNGYFKQNNILQAINKIKSQQLNIDKMDEEQKNLYMILRILLLTVKKRTLMAGEGMNDMDFINNMITYKQFIKESTGMIKSIVTRSSKTITSSMKQQLEYSSIIFAYLCKIIMIKKTECCLYYLVGLNQRKEIAEEDVLKNVKVKGGDIDNQKEWEAIKSIFFDASDTIKLHYRLSISILFGNGTSQDGTCELDLGDQIGKVFDRNDDLMETYILSEVTKYSINGAGKLLTIYNEPNKTSPKFTDCKVLGIIGGGNKIISQRFSSFTIKCNNTIPKELLEVLDRFFERVGVINV